ncbi:MAG: transposase [Betaproteobacteria bacterium]|nr:transposase [Betaproteobacteria bacterium]
MPQVGNPKTNRTESGNGIRVSRSESWDLCRGYPPGLLATWKATDNAVIEAFNGCFRTERLNQHSFLTLADARKIDGGLAQRLQ